MVIKWQINRSFVTINWHMLNLRFDGTEFHKGFEIAHFAN